MYDYCLCCHSINVNAVDLQLNSCHLLSRGQSHCNDPPDLGQAEFVPSQTGVSVEPLTIAFTIKVFLYSSSVL